METATKKVFRRDIQGLRGLAVIAVVLYHFDLGLAGGFLGVDIFFVISGFVIAQLLVTEVQISRTVNLARFFKRRFLRLAPALAVTALITSVSAYFFLAASPRQEDILWTAIGSMFGVSNAVIERLSGGYFGSAPEMNALVHTWSLSVEWQFYLALPFAVLLAGALANRRPWQTSQIIFVFILLASLFSFISTFLPKWFIGNGPIGALFGFYSPFSRAWEFGAGILVFLISSRISLSANKTRFGLLAGAILVTAGLILGNPQDFSPGLDALTTVAGTSLLLLAGGAQSFQKSLVSKFLHSRALFEVGERSYSLYLWHWPVAYLLKEFPDLHVLGVWVVISVGLLFTELSYRFLESPFRRRSEDSPSRPQTNSLLVVALPMVALLAMLPAHTSLHNVARNFGAWVVLHEGDTGHRDFHNHVASNFWPCTPEHIRESALSWGGFLRCQQSKPSSDIDLAIIGDSHAEHLFLGLAESLSERNIAYYILGELPVPESSTEMASILRHVESSSTISTVVITSYWAGRGLPNIELERVVQRLSDSGKAVFLTNDVPSFGSEPWFCQSTTRFAFLGRPDISQCTSVLEDGNLIGIELELMTISNKYERTYFVDTYRAFCVGNECKMVGPNIGLLYRDTNHLNLRGSRLAGETVAAAIREQ